VKQQVDKKKQEEEEEEGRKEGEGDLTAAR